MMVLKTEFTNNPSSIDTLVLTAGLSAEVPKTLTPNQTFGFFVRDENGSVVAGATGNSILGIIYTSLLWVLPELRGNGHGRQLMKRVEELGLERGCAYATVNTFSFQALSFYVSLGFEIEFERKGFEGDVTLYFLIKSLKRL